MMIRFTRKSNPLGLKIGERVNYRKKCYVAYDDNDERKLFFDEEKDFEQNGFIIGCIKKALGKYIKGSQSIVLYEDYEPPRLAVSSYIWLYELKNAIDKKSFLVHPDDIILKD